MPRRRKGERRDPWFSFPMISGKDAVVWDDKPLKCGTDLSGKRRYAVYAVVYLAPYLRSNLSISPEESWLPIASILLCIVHIQIEASIKNGDIQGIQVFNEVAKHLSSITQKKNGRNSTEVLSMSTESEVGWEEIVDPCFDGNFDLDELNEHRRAESLETSRIIG